MKIIHGDCLEEMKKMEDNSIDCVVTDPPYGLSFMGKKWDKEVPSVDYWKEMLRIAKPGSFLLAAGAPRSHHHLAMAIENAGWEITDCIMHLFGSGFPKGKSQLKPAYEPWILARKKANKVQHLNIDDSRIPHNEIVSGRIELTNEHEGYDRPWKQDKEEVKRRKLLAYERTNNLGRWPSNLILGDEEVEQMLDEQSGILKSGGHKQLDTPKLNSVYGKFSHANINNFEPNSGSASRFFYCAKASKSERGEDNGHPTVKPQKLMEYLIKLVMPKHENVILLDPFLGSGSTLVACQKLGVNAIGIEMNEEYCEIARKRLQVKPTEQLNLF